MLPSDETQQSKDKAEFAKATSSLSPFPVQLSNLFVIEMVAKRFPVPWDDTSKALLNVSIEDVEVNEETSQAVTTLSVQVNFSDEPRPFEISFKLLGDFIYNPQEYTATMVHQSLSQGSFNIMLPFARELLMSICTRLQIPLLILQMVHATPPLSSNE